MFFLISYRSHHRAAVTPPRPRAGGLHLVPGQRLHRPTAGGWRTRSSVLAPALAARGGVTPARAFRLTKAGALSASRCAASRQVRPRGTSSSERGGIEDLVRPLKEPIAGPGWPQGKAFLGASSIWKLDLPAGKTAGAAIAAARR